MRDPFCNERDFVMAMFYDTDRAAENITKPFEFALSLQNYLVEDVANGDLYMQRYVAKFLASSLYLSYTPGYSNATQSSSWSNGTYSSPYQFANASYYDYSFLENKTYHDLHMEQWKRICPWGTCGAFVFESYKVNLLDQFLPLNKYNYQVCASYSSVLDIRSVLYYT